MAWDGQERRNNPHLTKEDIQEIITGSMNLHSMGDEHAFIRTLIKKEQRKQELYESLKGKLAGYTILIVLTFVAVSLWHEILGVIKRFIGAN